ncbi:MAG: hypothetical protein QF745_04275 [Planctomycetota bacterium]|jgi:hypothetical protein|nr:hypothetical protein [Planctomycetota bacterium]
MKFNPATLPKNEINSGKIWSLLRFNEEFGKDIQWFSEKYKRSKNKRVRQENRDKAISELHNKFEEINSKHPLAGTALQWMFPMPRIIKKNGEEVTGHPFSWGPVIWPAKGDKIDVLKEWKEYEAGENQLTLKTDWPSANEGFKRVFMFQYRQFDSRPVNPITKNRSDSTFPHETDFFDDLDLVGLINEGPNLSEAGLGKVLYANELKKNYRTFAVPRHLKTMKAVDDAFKLLIKSIKASMPTKASGSLGTITEWQNFMAVKGIQEEQNIPSKTKAIHILIKQRHSKKDGFKMRDARRTYEKEITENFNSIQTKIGAIYPILLI